MALFNKKKEPKIIVSPTYNLIQDYNCGKKKIVCHIDLYRLKNIKEILKIRALYTISNTGKMINNYINDNNTKNNCFMLFC